MADIATQVHPRAAACRSRASPSVYAPEKKRWYVKVPAFSFSKIRGLDAYLSPEMKSTGEAIGYDDKLTRALYKALQASGMKVTNYGTMLAHHRRPATRRRRCRSSRRFYNLGFNIEATSGTADVPAAATASARACDRKISEGSERNSSIRIRQGHVSYVINTRDLNSLDTALRRLRNPPLRRGKQRDHVYRPGHGEGASRRAGRDDA